MLFERESSWASMQAFNDAIETYAAGRKRKGETSVAKTSCYNFLGVHHPGSENRGAVVPCHFPRNQWKQTICWVSAKIQKTLILLRLSKGVIHLPRPRLLKALQGVNATAILTCWTRPTREGVLLDMNELFWLKERLWWFFLDRFLIELFCLFLFF